MYITSSLLLRHTHVMASFTYPVLSEFVGGTEVPAGRARDNPARAASFRLMPGELAEDDRLPAARAAPTAVRTRLLHVPLPVGGQEEARAEGAWEQPARRPDVLDDLRAPQELRAFGTPSCVARTTNPKNRASREGRRLRPVVAPGKPSLMHVCCFRGLVSNSVSGFESFGSKAPLEV